MKIIWSKAIYRRFLICNGTNPHFSPRFYCGLENAAAKLVSAEIALNILSSMPRLFPLATSLFAGIFVAS
jgi:hypothetical protein